MISFSPACLLQWFLERERTGWSCDCHSGKTSATTKNFQVTSFTSYVPVKRFHGYHSWKVSGYVPSFHTNISCQYFISILSTSGHSLMMKAMSLKHGWPMCPAWLGFSLAFLPATYPLYKTKWGLPTPRVGWPRKQMPTTSRVGMYLQAKATLESSCCSSDCFWCWLWHHGEWLPNFSTLSFKSHIFMPLDFLCPQAS